MELAQITVVLNHDNPQTVKGARADYYDDVPRPLDKAALEALFPDLNAAALARVAELETELATKENEKTTAQTALAEIEAAALANPEDLEAIVLKSIEGRRPEIDKQKAALEAEIAAKQAELDALNAK